MPRILVAALSALPLIANRIRGKSTGNTSSARCRSVRVTDRRATAPTCWTSETSGVTAPPAPAAPRRLIVRRLLAGALELASGLRQKHIVKRGLVQLEQ